MKRGLQPSMALISKQQNHTGHYEKKNHKPISLTDAKILNNSKIIHQVIKKIIIHHNYVGFNPAMQFLTVSNIYIL